MRRRQIEQAAHIYQSLEKSHTKTSFPESENREWAEHKEKSEFVSSGATLPARATIKFNSTFIFLLFSSAPPFFNPSHCRAHNEARSFTYDFNFRIQARAVNFGASKGEISSNELTERKRAEAAASRARKAERESHLRGKSTFGRLSIV